MAFNTTLLDFWDAFPSCLHSGLVMRVLLPRQLDVVQFMSQIFYIEEGKKVKILVMRLGTMKGRISVTPAKLGSVRIRRETSVHQNCRSRLRLRCKTVAVRLPGMDRHSSLGRPRLQYV